MFTLIRYRDRDHPLLPPANEVCEGYVFTRVCLSTGGRGAWPRGVPAPGGVCSGGMPGPGGPAPGGGPRGSALADSGLCHYALSPPAPGGAWSWGVCRTPSPRDGYCCGRYTSYWNALLIPIVLDPFSTLPRPRSIQCE